MTSSTTSTSTHPMENEPSSTSRPMKRAKLLENCRVSCIRPLIPPACVLEELPGN